MTSNIQDSSLFYQKYQIECQIGRGASGVCYKVKKIQDCRTYALKKISSNFIKKNNIKGAYNQVSILSSLQHSNIIRYYQSFMDLQDLYIIMQYAAKGDLHTILKKRKLKRQYFQQKQIWIMIRQLLTALEYLHNKNIIHRDLKTLNIFVDDNDKLIIGDLGVSKIIKSDLGLYSRVGTPLYLPPEIIKYQKYDFKADIWGLGCVSYLLTTLNHPFEGKNIITLGQNIINSNPKPIEKYSSKLAELILEMLQKDMNKRLSATSLLKKYFQKNQIYQVIKPSQNINKKDIKIQSMEIEEFQQQNRKQQSLKIDYYRNQKIQRRILIKPKNDKIPQNPVQNKIQFKQTDNFKYQKKLSYLIGNFVSQSLDLKKGKVQSINNNSKQTINNNDNKQFDNTIILKPKKSSKTQNQIGNQQITKNQKQLDTPINVKKITQVFNCLKPKQAQLVLRPKISQKKLQSNNFLKLKVHINGTKKNMQTQSLQSFQPMSQIQQIKKAIRQSQSKDYKNNILASRQSQICSIRQQKQRQSIKQSNYKSNKKFQYENKKQTEEIIRNVLHTEKSCYDSQNIEGVNKIRNRPKSSIGRRDVMRQSSNIKPRRKQPFFNAFSNIIQTKILKKPQVIVL